MHWTNLSRLTDAELQRLGVRDLLTVMRRRVAVEQDILNFQRDACAGRYDAYAAALEKLAKAMSKADAEFQAHEAREQALLDATQSRAHEAIGPVRFEPKR